MPLATHALPRRSVVLGMRGLSGLLPHEARLEPEEREPLELLATEGARVLYRARGIAAGVPS
ncbi:hypothetical protein F0U62_22685 [Cystobacter fuscus]|uniref:hypothetical protein n=1 Tax=Cystobacter fuscus TaxID=43 RepID=UPI002B316347|nr:hypothetical protein F0U62_22685 [Cystobacter fuscus]